MNAAAEAEYRKRAMDLLTSNGGRITLAEIRRAMVMPPVHVTEVMRRMCAERLVTLQGETTYVLPPKQPQDTLDLRVDPEKNSCRVLDKPVRAMLEATSEAMKMRECMRCHVPQEPREFEREGLVRAARICNTCEGKAEKPPERSREQQVTGKPVAIDTTAVEKLSEALQTLDVCELRIPINEATRAHLERLVRTGLFGTDIHEAAERLVWSGIEQRLHFITKAIP